MIKLIVVQGPQVLIDKICDKYTQHIRFPIIGELEPDPEKTTEPTQENFIDDLKLFDSEVKSCLFLVQKHHTFDPDELVKHFNCFFIWTDLTRFDQHKDKHGLWIASDCEIDFTFNQLIPWVFD